MKITLEDTDGIYTIELKDDFCQIQDYVSLLIIPVLKAAGFADGSINKYISEGVYDTTEDVSEFAEALF